MLRAISNEFAPTLHTNKPRSKCNIKFLEFVDKNADQAADMIHEVPADVIVCRGVGGVQLL